MVGSGILVALVMRINSYRNGLGKILPSRRSLCETVFPKIAPKKGCEILHIAIEKRGPVSGSSTDLDL